MEGYSDGDFDVSENYYKSDDDYFTAMHIENEKNKNVAYDFVSNMGQNNGKKTATFSVSLKEYKRVKVAIYCYLLTEKKTLIQRRIFFLCSRQ